MNKHIAAINRLPKAKTVLIEQLQALRKPVKKKWPYLQNVFKDLEYLAKKQAIKEALLAIKVNPTYDGFLHTLALHSLQCIENESLSHISNTSNRVKSLTYLTLYHKVYNRVYHAI
jgi:hypothetical protein